jgi:hypothetical protein
MADTPTACKEADADSSELLLLKNSTASFCLEKQLESELFFFF